MINKFENSKEFINTRNKILLFILFMLITFGFGQGLPTIAPENPIPEVNKVQSKQLDDRAATLAAYFRQYNSPLEYQAQDFIDAADTYKVDWKLVPAIAGVESTFGKHIPGGYNAWGWGVYGDQSLGFSSWRDGIFTVTGGLKTGYIDKGLTDPYAMNRVYAASPTWGAHVSHFLADIDQFAATYHGEEKSTPRVNALSKTAATSAQLASK
jgi:hypothetical protein